jgi:exonuclease III
MLTDEQIVPIDIEKYAEALNNLIGADSAYFKGDKDVDAIVELIVLAKKMERITNRQKAEKEALIAGQKTIAEKNEEIEKLKDTLNRANKYGLEADKEINRLKHVLDSYALQYGTVTDQSKKIKEIKDEAYKEFAERLKAKSKKCKCGQMLDWGD